MIRILIQTQSPDPGSAGPPLIQVPLGFNPVWSDQSLSIRTFHVKQRKEENVATDWTETSCSSSSSPPPPPPELSTPLPEEKPDTCSSAADSGQAVLVLFFKTLKETLNFNNKLIKFSQESIYWFNLFSSSERISLLFFIIVKWNKCLTLNEKMK